jgi:hypothetical protein
MSHAELVQVAYRWVLKNAGCGVAFREFKAPTKTGEQPDVIGFGPSRSVLIECKASRADFHADKKKLFRKHTFQGMGKYRFYLCPTGVIKPEDLPDNWGLIYVNEKKRATAVHNPYATGNLWQRGFIYNQEAEQSLLYAALRRFALRGLMNTIYRPLPKGKH